VNPSVLFITTLTLGSAALWICCNRRMVSPRSLRRWGGHWSTASFQERECRH